MDDDQQLNHECYDVPEEADWFDYEDALMRSAEHGCTKCVDKLIRAGADVNTSDGWYNPLMEASRFGHVECVRLLIEAGADINLLFTFMSTLGMVQGVKTLIQVGVDVNETDDETGATALIEAAGIGSKECVQALLEAGADINRTDNDGRVALMHAAVRNFDQDCILALLGAGADVNKTDTRGSTALMYAAGMGNQEIVQALVEGGADVDVVDRRGWTALTNAASCMDNGCLKLLIDAQKKKKADVKDDIDNPFLVVMEVSRNARSFPTPEALGQRFRCTQLVFKIGGYVNYICNDNDERSKSSSRIYFEQSSAEFDTGEVKINYDRNVLTTLLSEPTMSKEPISSMFHTGQVPMLMLAGGEKVDPETKNKILKKYMSRDDQDELSLMHLSREAVRNQMMETHPHDNLFSAVSKLDIPETLKAFLLYDMSLDEEFIDDGVWKKYLGKTDDDEDEDDDDTDGDDDDGGDVYLDTSDLESDDSDFDDDDDAEEMSDDTGGNDADLDIDDDDDNDDTNDGFSS